MDGGGDRTGEPPSDDRHRFTTAALDAMQDLFYAFDTDATLVEYNQRLLAVTGYTAAEVAEMEPWEFFPADQRELISEHVARALEDEQRVSVEAELLTSTGERLPYEFTGAPYYTDGAVAGFVGVGRDITARRERERSLRRTDEFLRQAQAVANLGCWEVDFRSAELRWTEQVFRILDMDPETQSTPGVEASFEFYHPDDRDTVAAAFERLRDEHTPYDREVRVVSATDEVKWVRTRGVPWETDGEVVGARGTVQDITDRVTDRLELRQQRDDLETLTRLLSHDLRNNLQVVTARADHVTDHVDGGEQRHVETILRNADNAIELVESARTLATAMLEEDRTQRPVPLRRVLQSEVDELRAASPSASVTVDGSVPNCSVLADEMLSSVFRNLLQNAVQHNDAAVPEVHVSATVLDTVVEIRVADNGPGIPAELRGAPFGEAEKGRRSDGTGVGLYLVRTLVESYGGDVRVEDNEPRGSVFVVTLPRAG